LPFYQETHLIGFRLFDPAMMTAPLRCGGGDPENPHGNTTVAMPWAARRSVTLSRAPSILRLDGTISGGGDQGPQAPQLAKLFRSAGPGLQIEDYLDQYDGAIVFDQACKFGLEGSVLKRCGSRYESGRSSLWLKT
jgi:hypothetical protein